MSMTVLAREIDLKRETIERNADESSFFSPPPPLLPPSTSSAAPRCLGLYRLPGGLVPIVALFLSHRR